MKKKFLLIIVFLLILCGCKSNEKQEPFKLNDEYYEKSEIIDIKSTKYEELINDNKSFGLFIYLPGCISCASFKEVLKSFQEENTITFYSMSVEEMQKTDINEYVKYAPSFIIFKDGKKIAYLDSVSDTDLPSFETVNGFKDWLTKYVIL